MTTNQTIDGVPRKLLEDMLNPCADFATHERLRALLDAYDAQHAKPVDATHYYPKVSGSRKWRKLVDGAWCEWCGGAWLLLDHAMVDDYVPVALLDAPTECSACRGSSRVLIHTVCGASHKTCCRKPTTQPGPITAALCEWLLVSHPSGNEWVVKRGSKEHDRAMRAGHLSIAPLIPKAEQPAPVEVALPERRAVSPARDQAMCANSWNACLDELKRLNPSL
ncbi:hypothetical protein [Pseudomonas extremaustralis]|uniref:hypothetical protein n=1 Tax=Pseudomonas extremaustralis TaxID=359110 RepID=UPI0028582830|nr:hypothetical protein [Pseudomonas extremaustralis]MDR6580730.1 hypothetical protein [Pseudomonas extremaustralis]